MTRVPVVSERDIDAISPEALRVTSLQVVHANPSRPVLVLSVGLYHHGEHDGRTIDLALSPPAAAQLCRDLRIAVRDHLLGDESGCAR